MYEVHCYVFDTDMVPDAVYGPFDTFDEADDFSALLIKDYALVLLEIL